MNNYQLSMNNELLGKDGRDHVWIENIRGGLAFMCGGTLEIERQTGVGTTVVITIPKEG